MKTEKEKMLEGELYFANEEELILMRKKAKDLTDKYNQTEDLSYLEELFGYKFENVEIRPPFHCDYGSNIKLGKNVYMNFNCVILDCNKVEIGDNTLLAPNIQIYTAAHPLDVKTRNSGLEYAKPIKIGKNCWIGGGVIILPHVEIGDNCVVGAGSVVTKSIPANSVVVGNPARVVRTIEN